ncbi:lysylphosphatidylglycerol synthase domain-containing protein [Anaerolinea sp.]|uniref:lysylphosphatidylglycerol synthase domain-containing protein n=1 Tax=Anaerolinea sp. TaxID=1872519 RepID=UPI002ACE99D1|nr:lysylphosphatidylglycerol synthase domain-containing protein [Anaerolinea sp.]
MKQTARVIGFILGGGILIYQAVKGISFLLDSKIVPSFGWLLFSLLFGVLAIAVQILCWTLIMRDLGASISFRQAMTGYVLNFLPRYIPGTLWGYLSRAEWLKNQYGVEYSASHWGSIVEVFLGVLSSLVAVLLFLPQGISPIDRFLIATGTGLLLFLLWVFLNKISSFPSFGKIANPLLGFKMRLNIWVLAAFLLTLNWLNYGLVVYGTVKAVTHWQTVIVFPEWAQFSGLFSISWLIGFLSWLFPAGLGPRDWILSQGLVYAKALPFEMAYLVAVLVRLSGILSEVLWVLMNSVMTRKKSTGTTLKDCTSTQSNVPEKEEPY